ncbi:MAG: signal peptidase I [Anaerolineae bacterium]|nr:signal peptidase I [Anaerolineae bacterium]
MDDNWNSRPEPIDPPPRGPGVARRFVHLIRDLLETILPAILIALLLNVFVGQATRVQGQSMEPNLHTDQRLVVEKVSYRFHGPRRGDVVVIRVPSQGEELLIKRVIGLPGETVEILNGQVYIDGQLLDEPYTDGSTRQGRIGRVVVPALHVFVMGDNRDHSNDSRTFGPVPIENIVGRAWLSYWPLSNAGMIQ